MALVRWKQAWLVYPRGDTCSEGLVGSCEESFVWSSHFFRQTHLSKWWWVARGRVWSDSDCCHGMGCSGVQDSDESPERFGGGPGSLGTLVWDRVFIGQPPCLTLWSPGPRCDCFGPVRRFIVNSYFFLSKLTWESRGEWRGFSYEAAHLGLGHVLPKGCVNQLAYHWYVEGLMDLDQPIWGSVTA